MSKSSDMKYVGLLFACGTMLCTGCFPEALPAPVTVSPENMHMVEDNPPQLTWRRVPEADYYWLQISRTENFSSLTLNASCTDTVYRPFNALAPGTYYWRVLGEESG